MLRSRKLVSLILFLFVVSSLLYGSSIPAAASGKIINVTDYLVNITDGDSDDTAAVQTAIDAAVEGDTVYFPKGTYNISTIEIKVSGIKLTGESETGAILKFMGKPETECMITIYDVSGVTISKLTVTAAGDNKVLNGILAENSTTLLISQVTVKDFVLDTESEEDWGPHGIQFTGDEDNNHGVTDSEISNCTILNIGTNSLWGAGIRISKGSSRNEVLRNTLSNFGRGGILCNDRSVDLIIRNNKITGCGLYDDPEEDGAHNGEPLGIELFGECFSGIVEDNTVDHWISIAADSNYCAVRRNTVEDFEGLSYSWCQLELAEANNTVFTDNYAGSGAQSGISMSNFEGDTPIEYGYFAYNTIKDPALYAVNFDGEGDSIRNIYLYKNDVLGSVANHSRSEGPGFGGVGLMLNGTDNVTFDTCRFDAHERYGVKIMPALDDDDNIIATDVDHIRFINSSITNSGKAFAFSDDKSISDYKDYNSFEFVNSEVSGNGDNNIPQQKSFDNDTPIAVINAPSTGVVGQHLRFSSASYDPDGSIEHVLWDFGAGVPLSDPRSVIAYDGAGTYRVTLIVWDNEGKASRVEKTITITEDTETATEGNELALTPNPAPAAPPAIDRSNLAFDKPVAASEGFEDGCDPENAVNGTDDYPEWGPTAEGDKWLVVDLGEEMSISRYVVSHISTAGDPEYLNTKDFKIQKSSDQSKWEDVDVVDGNVEAITDKNLEPFTARYVRLLITTPAQDEEETQGRILEFQLFKDPKSLIEPEEESKPEILPIIYPTALEKAADQWSGSKEPISRGEFISLIVKALGLTKTDTSSFNDTQASAYKNEINKAKTAGIVSGTGAGIFKPEYKITRQEAAVIIMKAYLHAADGRAEDMVTSVEMDFDDQILISSWADRNVTLALSAGLMDSEINGTFNPKGNVYKSDAVLLAKKLYEKLVLEGIIL